MPNYRHGPGIDLQMGLRYYQRVLKTARPNLVAYLTLGETASLTALDESGNGCNGTMNPAAGAVALAQPGIGDDRTSVLFNAAGYCSITGAALTSLNSKFNGREMTICSWRKSSVIGATGRSIYLFADLNNRIYLERWVTNFIQVVYVANATVKNVQYTPASVLDWGHVAVTISLSANELRFYVGGVQQGATLGALGAWAGALTLAIIGAEDIFGTRPYIGNIQHVSIWNTVLTPGQIKDLSRYG